MKLPLYNIFIALVNYMQESRRRVLRLILSEESAARPPPPTHRAGADAAR